MLARSSKLAHSNVDGMLGGRVGGNMGWGWDCSWMAGRCPACCFLEGMFCGRRGFGGLVVNGWRNARFPFWWIGGLELWRGGEWRVGRSPCLLYPTCLFDEQTVLLTRCLFRGVVRWSFYGSTNSGCVGGLAGHNRDELAGGALALTCTSFGVCSVVLMLGRSLGVVKCCGRVGGSTVLTAMWLGVSVGGRAPRCVCACMVLC